MLQGDCSCIVFDPDFIDLSLGGACPIAFQRISWPFFRGIQPPRRGEAAWAAFSGQTFLLYGLTKIM